MVKVAILHEGKNTNKESDNGLLRLLLEDLDLPVENVKFIGMGTKSNFFKEDNVNYRDLKNDIEAEQISKVLFVVDADYETNDTTYGGYANTRKELQSIIGSLGFTAYSDIYVTCDDTQCGYLESLILSTIPEKHRTCIESFLDCSDFAFKENHKAILHQIYKTAYPKAPFDLKHSKFDQLKEKLQNLFLISV